MTPSTETSAGRYILGFLGSLVCTFAAYGIVVYHVAGAGILLPTIVGLALLQLFLQLVFFMHVGERGNALNRAALGLAFIIVCIVIIGSLWIMFSLNGRMMPTPAQMLQYTQGQDSM